MEFVLQGSTTEAAWQECADRSVRVSFPVSFWAGHAMGTAYKRTTFTAEEDRFTVLVTPPAKSGEAHSIWFNVTNGDRCWRVTVAFPRTGMTGSATLESEVLSARPEELYLARTVKEHDLRRVGFPSDAVRLSGDVVRVFDYGDIAGIEVPSSAFTMRVLTGYEARRSMRLRPISIIRPDNGDSDRKVRMAILSKDLVWELEAIFGREGIESSLAPVG